MDATEQKLERRIRTRLPIRVLGFDEARGRFQEDTHTIVVSPTGSLIALKTRVFPADVIRIINLANVQEADFRVVGPSAVTASEVAEWGVECLERERNIWGIEFPPVEKEPDVLLECRACHRQERWPATVLEREVLDSTGMIALNCMDCKKPTYWTYVNPEERPQAFSQAEVVAPPPRVMPVKEFMEKRKRKRLLIKLPILVRTAKNQQEVSKTENLSNAGLAVSLEMELEVGEVVTVICPYAEAGQAIEQRAVVRWRDPYPASSKRMYGLDYRI